MELISVFAEELDLSCVPQLMDKSQTRMIADMLVWLQGRLDKDLRAQPLSALLDAVEAQLDQHVGGEGAPCTVGKSDDVAACIAI